MDVLYSPQTQPFASSFPFPLSAFLPQQVEGAILYDERFSILVLRWKASASASVRSKGVIQEKKEEIGSVRFRLKNQSNNISNIFNSNTQ